MDKRCCRQNIKPSCCPQPCATKRGPMEPQFPQESTGPAGSPGLTPDYNVTIYNTLQQNISNQKPISMPDVEINKGFTLQDSSLVVQLTGTYLISFSMIAI
ncbi:MAG: hypothetical protein MR862_01925 [Clostridia bacterium]|nr:hypothetical protein [Clostridia bacterium]